MLTYSTTALFVALLASGLYALYRCVLPRPIPGIPHNADSARHVLGDVPHMLELQNNGKRPREFWANLCRDQKSPIVQFFPGPFNKPVVVISDYREARDLLIRKTRLVDKGEMVKMIWSGVMPTHFIGFNSKNPMTAESKALVKDMIGTKFLTTISSPAIYRNMMNLIDLWSWKTEFGQGRPFEAIDDLCFFTADIIFETALGVSGDDKNIVRQLAQLQTESHFAAADETKKGYPYTKFTLDGLLNAIVQLTVIAGGLPTAPIPALFWPVTNLKSSVKKLRTDAHRLLSQHISDVLRWWEQDGKPETMNTALEFIISREIETAEKQGRRPDFQRKVLHDAIFGYCLGGQDTTHSTLSFLVKCLGEFPSVQQWLRVEMEQVFTEALHGHRNPTETEIREAKVPCLEAYMEEVMRLYPAAPAIPKETMEDCNILGYQVPKGTTVLLSVLGPSTGEPAIPVPESARSESSRQNNYAPLSRIPLSEFSPERWLRKDPATGESIFDSRAAPQMGFSLGPRECWGKRLAYLQLRMFMVLFMWNFKCVELPEHLVNWEINDALNARPKTCLVKLRTLTRKD